MKLQKIRKEKNTLKESKDSDKNHIHNYFGQYLKNKISLDVC